MKITDAIINQLNVRCDGMELRIAEPMSAHTTFRIGGAAAVMALPTTQAEFITCLTAGRALGVRIELIGNGSNLLVADEGIDAFVVSTCAMDAMTVTAEGKITAEAGVLLARLANFSAQHALAGLTFAHGIPGSLGGAVTMNAGAYGGEMRDVVHSVRCLSPEGEIIEILGEDAEFSYRHSLFCTKNLPVLDVTLRLGQGDGAMIQAEMTALAVKRRTSQPLEYPSGGSMFKRPEGYYAAALIDQCGLKGYTVGGAQVSEKHAGFVVNRGGATCADMIQLVHDVQKRVAQETGVTLEMEVMVLR